MKTDEEMEDILCGSQLRQVGDHCRVLHFANDAVLLDGYFSLDNLKSMVTAWDKALGE